MRSHDSLIVNLNGWPGCGGPWNGGSSSANERKKRNKLTGTRLNVDEAGKVTRGSFTCVPRSTEQFYDELFTAWNSHFTFSPRRLSHAR